jgi:hypothetical protein
MEQTYFSYSWPANPNQIWNNKNGVMRVRSSVFYDAIDGRMGFVPLLTDMDKKCCQQC